jgi:hypothetical protein
MSKKQEIAIIFMKIQNKIGDVFMIRNVFMKNEHGVNDVVDDLLTDITLQLDEAMKLVAELEE